MQDAEDSGSKPNSTVSRVESRLTRAKGEPRNEIKIMWAVWSCGGRGGGGGSLLCCKCWEVGDGLCSGAPDPSFLVMVARLGLGGLGPRGPVSADRLGKFEIGVCKSQVATRNQTDPGGPWAVGHAKPAVVGCRVAESLAAAPRTARVGFVQSKAGDEMVL